MWSGLTLASGTETLTQQFEWLPPNVEPALAARYMTALPLDKRPITGSQVRAWREARKQRRTLTKFLSYICKGFFSYLTFSVVLFIKKLNILFVILKVFAVPI